MKQPIMRRIQGDNLKINAAFWEGSGRTIICLHGITANCRSWDFIAGKLAPEFRVIGLDLRGRGLSDKPEKGYSADHHIKDILKVMKSLNIEKTVLMGHSLGAFIALVFAVRHPELVEKMILIDGAGDLSKEQMNHVLGAIKPALDRLKMTFDSADSYIEHMKSAPYINTWQPEIEAYYRHEIQAAGDRVKPNINPDIIIEEADNLGKINCASLYNSVACPVLILKATQGVFSQDDLLLPEDAVEKMVKNIPYATRFDVQGTNHYEIIFQRHKKRDEAIFSFLNQ